MTILQQVAFLIVLGVAVFFVRKRALRIKGNIALGKHEEVTGDTSERWKNVLLVAFGQKKMFKRPLPAIFHFFIYFGFLVINLEVLEFIIDGLAGTHRIFAPFLGGFYTVLMNIFEFLAVAVLGSCVIFLFRRNVIKLPRFQSTELNGWPRKDGNIILFTEIVLMCAILSMNATDQVLQTRPEHADHYVQTGSIFFSAMLVPLFSGLGDSTLVFIERFAWWFHIIGIL
jgi:hypothetical protein